MTATIRDIFRLFLYIIFNRPLLRSPDARP